MLAEGWAFVVGNPRFARDGVKPWALAAILCLGCTGEIAAQERLLEAPALFSSSDDVERVRSAVEFDTLWVFGGPSDTLLAAPRLPRPDGAQGVVFFDVQNQAAYRLGGDGELLWSWGRKGEGPGELRNVRALDVAADGSVVLVDSGNRRVVRLSADGRLLEEAPVPARSGYVQSVAALRGGRLAVDGSVGGSLLALWDGDDAVAVESPTGLGKAYALLQQGTMVRWGDDGWVFGFFYGNGWATFREAQLLGVFPYVEHFNFPRARQVRRGNGVSTRMVRRPAETGRSLSVVGDTLFVLFGGEKVAGWALDKFDLRSGAYLETEVLPHFANSAVVGEERVFTIEAWDVYPRIVALARRATQVPRASPPRPQAAQSARPRALLGRRHRRDPSAPPPLSDRRRCPRASPSGPRP